MKFFCVYMLADSPNGTLYVGMTSDLKKRVYEHKWGLVEEFTSKYDVHSLVWYEAHESAESAIAREGQLKKWNRHWKIREIENMNPSGKTFTKHWADRSGV